MAKELGIDGGTSKPKGKKIVVGWGTKTKEDITFPTGTKVLNHPNSIRRNRNKFGTLEALKNAGVAVAPFVLANGVLTALDNGNSAISLPLVGRTKYHQGGKGFWMCLTKTHVRDAIDEGAQYFQNYVDIADEFRLHIFKEKLLYAQKKVKRDNMEEAFVAQHREKIENFANKAETKLDKKTLDYALGRIAKEHKHADMIVRSNHRGWRFAVIKKVNDALLETAKTALAAAGLNFGAVDCCLDAEGRPWVIEINSGPGLDGSTLKTYVETLGDALKEIMSPPKEEKAPPKETKAKTVKAISKVKSESKLENGSARERLTGLRELLRLVEDADEAEAATIEKLVKRKYLGA